MKPEDVKAIGADDVSAWLTENCGRGLPFADATDLPTALHGLAYTLRQIEGTNSYRPHIGQCGPASTSIRWALEYIARAEMNRATQSVEEYMTVTLSKDGKVTFHSAYDADFDEMVVASQTIVGVLQKRISDRRFCPYSHGAKLRSGSLATLEPNHD